MKFWIWIMYLIPIPELTLWIGSFLPEGTYDCVFAQAYAWERFWNRGRLIKCDKEVMALVNKIRAENPTAHDGQLFRILQLEGFKPGKSNRVIAHYCIEKSEGIRKIYAQWEVAMEIFRIEPGLYNGGLLRTIWPKPGASYITTKEVKIDSVKMMVEDGLSDPLEIAHHGMWPRAMLIIHKLGVAPAPFIRRIPWTGQKSGQPKTAKWSSWVPYETLVRIHHIVKRIVV